MKTHGEAVGQAHGTLSHLAWTIEHQGRLAEAVGLYEKMLATSIEAEGETSRWALSARMDLARLAVERGQWETAKEQLDALLGDYKGLMRPHIESESECRFWRAQLELRRGQFDEASKLFTGLLETATDHLGEKHSLTLNVRQSLAVTARSRGEPSTAEEILRSTLAMQEKLLGPGNRDTLATVCELAWAVAAQGRHAEAIGLFAEVIDAETDASAHNRLSARHGLAWVAARRGKYSAAVTELRAIHDQFGSQFGQTHVYTLEVESDLAWVLGVRGETDEALRLYAHLLRERTRLMGSRNPLVRSTRHAMKRLRPLRNSVGG